MLQMSCEIQRWLTDTGLQLFGCKGFLYLEELNLFHLNPFLLKTGLQRMVSDYFFQNLSETPCLPRFHLNFTPQQLPGVKSIST